MAGAGRAAENAAPARPDARCPPRLQPPPPPQPPPHPVPGAGGRGAAWEEERGEGALLRPHAPRVLPKIRARPFLIDQGRAAPPRYGDDCPKSRPERRGRPSRLTAPSRAALLQHDAPRMGASSLPGRPNTRRNFGRSAGIAETRRQKPGRSVRTVQAVRRPELKDAHSARNTPPPRAGAKPPAKRAGREFRQEGRPQNKGEQASDRPGKAASQLPAFPGRIENDSRGG